MVQRQQRSPLPGTSGEAERRSRLRVADAMPAPGTGRQRVVCQRAAFRALGGG